MDGVTVLKVWLPMGTLVKDESYSMKPPSPKDVSTAESPSWVKSGGRDVQWRVCFTPMSGSLL
jgi:hypothetical protein